MHHSELHPQLLEDCHYLGSMPSGSLLLHRNAIIPWCILVPDTQHQDLLELEPALRNQVLEDARRVANILRARPNVERINIAALGNVVPQLHLHIIGRHAGDHCWPAPVWGNVTRTEEWDASALQTFQQALGSAAGEDSS